VTPPRRLRLVAPSEWDIVLAPELGPLFVLDAALLAARRHFLAIGLDPSSSTPGGANHPPTRDLLEAMRALRRHIRRHRLAEQDFVDRRHPDPDDPKPVPR
jgi:hypothetical protein